MYSLILLAFMLVYIIYRTKRAQEPLYIYKTKILEDRFIEILFILVLSVWAIIKFLEIRAIGGDYFREIFPLVLSIVVVMVVTSIEYQKKQVGLYETGILFKSQFYPWKGIYTYRVYPGPNRTKITFFIHKSDPNKLQKNSIYLSEKMANEMVEILDTKLDVTRP